MSVSDGNQQTLCPLVEVCGHLPRFLDKGHWEPATALEDLVLRTLARSRGTYEAIVELIVAGRSLQAAMLGRSLFEDMAVAHWLVLHADDPGWLIEQFDGHRNAMRLYDADMRRRANWPSSGDDASDLAGREDELRGRFGAYAERDWWGRDREGKRLRMSDLVERLAAAERFHPRLRGEEPILERYYQLQHKAWTQALHHTAFGMEVLPGENGDFPLAVAAPSPYLILFGNYWVFGQLIFVALELGAPTDVAEYFQKLFFAGLAVFGEAVGSPVPWAADVEKWSREI